MCTGLEIALITGGLGIGGGSYLQNRSMNAKAEAADNVALAGLRRQDQFDRDRGQTFADALRDAESGISTDALEGTAKELTSQIQDNVGQRDITFQNASGAAPKVVQDTADRVKGEGNAYLDLLADARGRLGAWGSQMSDVATDIGRHGWKNDQLSMEALRDAQLTEQQAQHAYASTGNKTALAGNLATQLGAMFLTQGLYNHGVAAAASAGAPTVTASTPGVGVPLPTPRYNPYQALV